VDFFVGTGIGIRWIASRYADLPDESHGTAGLLLDRRPFGGLPVELAHCQSNR